MKKLIIGICIAAAVAALIAIGAFASHFGLGFAFNIGNWGAVGDFFGGVLNPTFSLLSLILIAYTLMQNKKALEQSEKAIEQGTKAIEQNEKALQVSNEELRLTRDELANSSDALKEQASLLAVQSFETTFFNMLELHNKLLSNIFYDRRDFSEEIRNELKIDFIDDGHGNAKNGLDSLNRLLYAMNSAHSRAGFKVPISYIFTTFYKYENKVFGSYCRNLYQILKLIKFGIKGFSEQKKYSNILRSQLSNQELTLLMVNCTNAQVDEGQFKELIIYFELFEHLDFIHVIPSDKSPSFFRIKNPTINISSEIIDAYIKLNDGGKLLKSAFGQNAIFFQYCEGKGYI
ncbi:hypothetical protein H5200_20450 [Pseudoalteromonas sp. SG43-7]|uniref:putative phage abortive infection protein n=1 Tax=Pseudoalteromonas sp. SG43-7 TaxID=2760966 RepID=UPI001602AE77|nr:putative phage abortive infection protein [Pseudoalteromonas sp. SG43-7]MBB1424268.1 hypothetical protein [Pseudoalteromonas sp. SG43-7]